jgi:hypothetical protein
LQEKNWLGKDFLAKSLALAMKKENCLFSFFFFKKIF